MTYGLVGSRVTARDLSGGQAKGLPAGLPVKLVVHGDGNRHLHWARRAAVGATTRHPGQHPLARRPAQTVTVRDKLWVGVSATSTDMLVVILPRVEI